jgi:hypothetical protein
MAEIGTAGFRGTKNDDSEQNRVKWLGDRKVVEGPEYSVKLLLKLFE